MSSFVRSAVFGLHVAAVAALVALASGCAANNDASSNEAASTTTNGELPSTPGLVFTGESGGRLYNSEQDMLQDWRNLAVEIDVLPASFGCSSVDTCTWNPTVVRASPDQWYLSDPVNNFSTPDAQTYNWIYLPSRNAWVFADRVTNPKTYALIEAYNVDVIYNKDTSANAAALAAPIEAWVDTHSLTK